MSKVISKKECVIYGVVSLAFVLWAVFANWSEQFMVEVFYKPFELLGLLIRTMCEPYGAVTMKVLGYILYIIIGILPLIYPLVKLIKNKRLDLTCIPWIIASIYLFVAMYFFINPHLFRSILYGMGLSAEITASYQALIMAGMAMIFYALVALGCLLQFSHILKLNDNKVYFLAKVLISIFIVFTLFNVFFLNIVNAKVGIVAMQGVPDSGWLTESVNVNKGVNIFYILFSYLIKLMPSILTILLLIKAKSYINVTQADIFNPANITVINSVVKLAKRTIFVTLLAMIVDNMLTLALSNWLMNFNFKLAVPFAMILAVCLVVIFSKILIKAIEINEENKLVI